MPPSGHREAGLLPRAPARGVGPPRPPGTSAILPRPGARPVRLVSSPTARQTGATPPRPAPPQWTAPHCAGHVGSPAEPGRLYPQADWLSSRILGVLVVVAQF